LPKLQQKVNYESQRLEIRPTKIKYDDTINALPNGWKE